MKAVVRRRYGSPDVLSLAEVEKPSPKDDEVLVKIHAASLNAYDWHSMRADPFIIRFSDGYLKPKDIFLGADFAGCVEAVGGAVTKFQPGDEVFGDMGSGGFAEYVSAPEKLLAHKPANLTYAEAAAVPMAALTALQGLRDRGQIQPGQQVLIHGASGGVGTFAVQLASAFGAEVTAVCSTSKVDLVRSLGAEHVIDYTREDFSRNGRQYDLILAANGNRSLSDYERALKPTGRFIVAGGSIRQMFQAILLGPRKTKPGGKTMSAMMAKISASDLDVLKEMIEAGKLAPVIDRTYSLDEVPAAMRYLEEGHARGKIVIAIVPETSY